MTSACRQAGRTMGSSTTTGGCSSLSCSTSREGRSSWFVRSSLFLCSAFTAAQHNHRVFLFLRHHRKTKSAGSLSFCKSSLVASLPSPSFLPHPSALRLTLCHLWSDLFSPRSSSSQLREATHSRVHVQKASSLVPIRIHPRNVRKPSTRRERVLVPLCRLHHPLSLLQLPREGQGST